LLSFTAHDRLHVTTFPVIVNVNTIVQEHQWILAYAP